MHTPQQHAFLGTQTQNRVSNEHVTTTACRERWRLKEKNSRGSQAAWTRSAPPEKGERDRERHASVNPAEHPLPPPQQLQGSLSQSPQAGRDAQCSPATRSHRGPRSNLHLITVPTWLGFLPVFLYF